jgi:hypothetical protein
MAGVRARAYPRQRSVNFRRLWWVALREAALHVIAPDAGSWPRDAEYRVQLYRRESHRVRTVAGILLALYPERRHWPPGTA